MEVLPWSAKELTLMNTDPVRLSSVLSATYRIELLLFLLWIFSVLLYVSLSFSVEASSPKYTRKFDVLFF